MSELSINLKWDLLDQDFSPGSYSVDHIITVNNDLSLPGSSAPASPG